MGSHELNNHRAIQAAQGIDPDTPEATRARDIAMFGAQETGRDPNEHSWGSWPEFYEALRKQRDANIAARLDYDLTERKAMTTPTQETGQPLDFTRPLELVCDGTEVVAERDEDGDYVLRRKDGRRFTPIQHPYGKELVTLTVSETGHRYNRPGPQIVRNRAAESKPALQECVLMAMQHKAAQQRRAEANTPVQADALVERLEAWADSDSQYGHHARAEDLYAAVTRLAHQPTTDAEAEVVRDIRGETVCGFRVAAWRETHPEHGKKLGHHYSEHWSTPNTRNPAVKVERLFTEDQLRAALAHPPADKARIAELERHGRNLCAAAETLRQVPDSPSARKMLELATLAFRETLGAPHAD